MSVCVTVCETVCVLCARLSAFIPDRLCFHQEASRTYLPGSYFEPILSRVLKAFVNLFIYTRVTLEFQVLADLAP